MDAVRERALGVLERADLSDARRPAERQRLRLGDARSSTSTSTTRRCCRRCSWPRPARSRPTRAQPGASAGGEPAGTVHIPGGPFAMGDPGRGSPTTTSGPATRWTCRRSSIDRDARDQRRLRRVRGRRRLRRAASCGRPRAGNGAWRRRRRRPLYWTADGARAPLRPGRAARPAVPVMHVSWYEADAFARWRGGAPADRGRVGEGGGWDPSGSRRYPWGDEPPSAARANLDQLAFGPLAVGSRRGRHARRRLRPDRRRWEWTASDFDGYPGFRAVPLPRVLRGLLRRPTTGCCAAARGPPARASPATRSATGTCPSGARSSPASAAPGTMSAVMQIDCHLDARCRTRWSPTCATA